MNSQEYWQGYHTARKGRFTLADCPYRFEPWAAKEWKRGFKAQVSERVKG